MVTVSGAARDASPGLDSDRGSDHGADLDARDALGTDRVLHRLRRRPGGFTLVACLDNLTFPAANAVGLLELLAPDGP